MTKKAKVLSIALFLAAFIMLISCQKQKAEWKGTIEEENGVTVVKNPKESMYGEDVFSLEEELSIGEGAGAEEYMFASVGGIFVDDEGKIIVSDSKDTVIKIFDVNGQFIRTIGRKGQGPGEYARIDSFQITSKGELLVVISDNHTTRTTTNKIPVFFRGLVDYPGQGGLDDNRSTSEEINGT